MIDNEVNVNNEAMDIQATPEIETTDNGKIGVEPTYIREEIPVINKGACIACGAAGLVTGLLISWTTLRFVIPMFKKGKEKVEEPAEEQKEA